MVSIIMVTYGRWELTKQCLDSLFAAGIKHDFEVIVVDNGSKDTTVENLKRYPGIRVVINKSGSHFSDGCNAGVKQSKGDLLLFLNNDIIIKDDFLTPMIDRMKSSNAGIVGARLLYPDGTIQHAGVGFKKNGHPRHVFKRWPGDSPEVMFPRRYQSVTAACMLVGRELYSALEGFDPVFKTGKEDVDFCLRAGSSGHSIWYEPKACMVHLEHQSPGRHAFDEYNRAIYLTRWKGKVKGDIKKIKTRASKTS